ncbi:MAG: dihydroorotate dehydrogenase (quinone) [Candidatus Puniceispirillum sp. TMED52]|nr:dihydroorotate dehydrogenase (quinone) [SAR116 cluster bacterium]OUU47109.1 MAG: dihydroorotate dehydrogenase (quinone) [Candidatus Puniceispirillum sp. TMED52]HCP19129.1 dihydroorotate dehydrogenase (quinone) [Alphaproteobacteria bacterium]
MISRLATSLAHRLPAEAAHRLAIWAMSYGLVPTSANQGLANQGFANQHTASRLDQDCLGLRFSNPLGLAAGFDKNAEAMAGAFRLGFGYVEVGTITPKPQSGNPKPRVFRLSSDAAVINRYGFNNDGAEQAKTRLSKWRKTSAGQRHILGVNIGANKDSLDRIADYAATSAILSPYADYITVNVSSPNTPGLRDMQTPSILAEIMAAVKSGLDRAHLPVLIKLAPDMNEADFLAVLERLPDMGASGVILTNTTISRPDSLTSPNKDQQGGLSGAPLLLSSTQWLALARSRLPKHIPLIGVGGIDNAAAAYAKILAGANLIQLYTALALQGSHIIGEIIHGLDALLARDGVKHITDAVGQVTDAAEALKMSGRITDRISG